MAAVDSAANGDGSGNPPRTVATGSSIDGDLLNGPSKKCRSCGWQIDEQAKLCFKCGKYQASWRDELLYYSSVVGFLSILVASISYAGGAILAFLTPDKLEILAFRSDQHAVLYNGGARPLAMLRVDYRADQIGSGSIDLYRAISPSDIFKFDQKNAKGFVSPPNSAKFLCDNKENLRSLAQSNPDKVVVIYAAEADPDVAQLVEANHQNNIIVGGECNLAVSYGVPGISLEGTKRTKAVRCVALLKSLDIDLIKEHRCRLDNTRSKR